MINQYYYNKVQALENKQNNQVLFAEDIDSSCKKRYFYSTYNHIFNFSKKLYTSFYEIIENSNQIKLFFDLENKNILTVTNLVSIVLKNYILEPQYIILTPNSISPSYNRIIIPNIIFNNMIDLKLFINEELKDIHHLIDKSVYKIGLSKIYLNETVDTLLTSSSVSNIKTIIKDKKQLNIINLLNQTYDHSSDLKIKYLKAINKVLEINDLILYNHENDSKKFNNPIIDKYILDNLQNILKLFRLTDKNYKDLHLINGYKNLYFMSLNIFKQLCGSEFIICKKIQKYKNNTKTYHYEYNINNSIIVKIKNSYYNL
jgi:hypothetical protein